MSLKGVKVGDPVWVSAHGQPFSLKQVSKVGRKYLSVGRHQFNIDSGRSTNFNGQCQTENQRAESIARGSLTMQLNELAVYNWHQFTTDQLQRMLAIAKEPKL